MWAICAAVSGWVEAPWPGQIPTPSPARIHPDPLPVALYDAAGRSVGVSGRGELSGSPDTLDRGSSGSNSSGSDSPGRGSSGKGRMKIVQWAGPWPADQRWWDPLTRRRRARMQVVLEDRSAHLLAIEQQAWSIEATYD